MFEAGEVELEQVHVLEGHEDRVWAVSWSPNGAMLASCSGDKTVRVWEREGGGSEEGASWVCKAILEEAHSRTIRSCDWSPCGSFLATASFDNTVAIWQLAHGEFECLASLEGHESEVKSAAWSSSGCLLASCSRDKSVWVWEAPGGGAGLNGGGGGGGGGAADFECAAVLSGHSQDVKMLTWHPLQDWLVSASYDNSIRVWAETDDGDDWRCVQTIDTIHGGHSSTVWCVAFDAEGKRMVSCSDDLSLKIWDTSCPPLDLQPSSASAAVADGASGPNGASGTSNSRGWKLLTTCSGYHDRTIFSVDWSPVNGLIATGAADDAIRIFSVEGNEKASNSAAASPVSESALGPHVLLLLTKERAHASDVNCVRWHPKASDLLASAGDDEVVRIWRLGDRMQPSSLQNGA